MPIPNTKQPPTSFREILKSLGPGLIISAGIVGSGELIVTTKLGAEQGFTLLWFIILGCFIKVFVQVELGRYAITQGKSTVDAMNSIPGPKILGVRWLVWAWLLMFIATFFQLSGIVGSIADVFNLSGKNIADMIGVGDKVTGNTIWALVITISCSVLLTIGRYKFIETFSTSMVALFTVFTIAAVISLFWTDYAITAANITEGLSFKVPDKIVTAFAAFGVIGVGASELIYYPYWCLEKGYASNVGKKQPDENEESWNQRAEGWIKVLKIDAWVSLIIYTGATIAFYLLGAAVLHGSGSEVTDKTLAPMLSKMYEESFGSSGLWIFIIGAFIVLYSTVFISTATNARLFADIFRIFRFIDPNNEDARKKVVWWTCLILPFFYLIVSLIFPSKPIGLVFAGAIAQALMLPFLAGAALYFHYAVTPKRLKPGLPWVSTLWISAILMAIVGSYQFYDKAKGFAGSEKNLKSEEMELEIESKTDKQE